MCDCTEISIENIKIDNKSIETESIETESIETESVETTPVLKPFRSNVYDNYDLLYANHMQYLYTYVELNIKNKFDIFTENLVYEKYINRNQLLNAIDNFKYKFVFTIKNKDEYLGWTKFSDEAFNYRPYQPCIIS